MKTSIINGSEVSRLSVAIHIYDEDRALENLDKIWPRATQTTAITSGDMELMNLNYPHFGDMLFHIRERENHARVVH